MKKLTWTPIGGVLDGLEIKPSEYLRKSMPEADWDKTEPVKERKYWRNIISEQDQKLIITILVDWQTDHLHPHAWEDIFAKSIKPETKDMMERAFAECREYGWFSPRVKDGVLSFGSLYPFERRYEDKKLTWKCLEKKDRQPGDDTDAENLFPKEEP